MKLVIPAIHTCTFSIVYLDSIVLWKKRLSSCEKTFEPSMIIEIKTPKRRGFGGVI